MYRREVLLIGGGLAAVFGGVIWNQVPVKTEEVQVLSVQSTDQADEHDQVYVDVGGGVKKPGVYGLVYGKRIADVIDAAGGLSVEADSAWVEKNLNKSEKIKDGMKLYIPMKGNDQNQYVNDNAQSSKPKQTNDKININEAGSGSLDGLPGVGEVTAQKIIDGRPYSRVEELLERKIVSKRVFEQIQDQVAVY